MRLPGPLRLLLIVPVLASGCGDAGPGPSGLEPPSRPGPRHARWEVVDMLRESLRLEFDPSDGGGRAWLESVEPETPQASTTARFTLVYEVGPLGVADGGGIYLQVSPFWDWSTPQTLEPEAPGYTLVTTEAEDVELDSATLDHQLLGIRVGGRALTEGERVRIVYGAGLLGAVVDTFAEKRARLWIAVDGNGDDVRKVLADSPAVEIRAGPPARLQVTLPSVARPGETVLLHLAVLDHAGNRGVPVTGEVRLEGAAPVLELPESVALEASDGGVKVVTGRVLAPGVVRLLARGPEELEALSNPLLASADSPRILWADLHGHTSLSDGTGTPEDYFLYARDVAGLDVVALTDHDHWGILPVDQHPSLWEEIQRETRRFHEPGRFVTLPGYEWTSWIYGHRHVLWFRGDATLYSSLDPATESPQQLWSALEGQAALTFAHHSAGGPIPTDWDIAPDPRFEPVTEIASVHGSSEALDSPHPIYDPIRGNFVRDALDRGHRLGFIGSGDGHDGHPGLAQLASPISGLAAILSEENTRDAVLGALRERRCYATNGPRILLRAAVGPHRMGSSIPRPQEGSLTEELFVHVVGTAPLERVDLIRSGAVVESLEIRDALEARFRSTLRELRSGEYVYVRAVQEDGGAAWSSPVFVE
jgi:hypothetical protein